MIVSIIFIYEVSLYIFKKITSCIRREYHKVRFSKPTSCIPCILMHIHDIALTFICINIEMRKYPRNGGFVKSFSINGCQKGESQRS